MSDITITEQVRADLRSKAAPGLYGSDHYRRRLRIFEKTGGRCWHCGCVLGFDWHADHLMPRAHGGGNELANMAPSCPGCNLAKADMVPEVAT